MINKVPTRLEFFPEKVRVGKSHWNDGTYYLAVDINISTTVGVKITKQEFESFLMVKEKEKQTLYGGNLNGTHKNNF